MRQPQALAITSRALAAGLVIALLGVPGVAVADVYWADFDGKSIGHAESDGSGVDPSLVAVTGKPLAVAVAGTHVYWTNPTLRTIGRANLDGSGVDQDFITAAANPQAVAVDAEHVYWTQDPDKIGRANLDGTGVDQAFITGANGPAGIVVSGSRLYWVNYTGKTIGRANTDGTGVTQNLITLTKAAIAVTVADRHLYWSALGGYAIGRANTDGTGVDETFLPLGMSVPYGIGTDGSQLVWSTAGNEIARANLDGSGVDLKFVTGATDPYGVAGFTPQATPAPQPRRAQVTVKVRTKARQGKLAVNVNPDLPGARNWRFTVQQLRRNGAWRALATYSTRTSKETRTLNLPKGRFRVVVKGNARYVGDVSRRVRLKR